MHRPASKNAPQIETVDPITGEVFMARTENHYEKNDGVPVAPAVQLPRKTLRERVEELYRGGRMMAALQHDGSPDDDMDIQEFDDPEPMTPSEKQYLLTEGLRELRNRPPKAPTAVPPSPSPVPPAEGQDAPAPSADRPAAPSNGRPPGT